jgi:hypothetical protein
MSNPEWLRPSKILECYCIPSGATNRDIVEVEKKLYLAVIKGDVRACFQGAILDPRWFTSQTFDNHNPYCPASRRSVVC